MNAKWINKIKTRREKLNIVKKELKGYFVGLDDIIDKIINNLEVWYVMPEVITRPVIINLWGMTGVGKTDLVRKLVEKLGFSDKFCEIQMDMDGAGWSGSKVQSRLLSSGIEEETPGVILFDEFQRFKTIDKDNDVKHERYQDIWMLLSDGKFEYNSNKINTILEKFMDIAYEQQIYTNINNVDNEKGKYNIRPSMASELKSLLKLEAPVKDIMKYTAEERMKLLGTALKNKNINKPDNYNKLLIFVSGNIDEAYTMANNVDDADNDADILYERSLGLTFVDIKTALTKRFKPEQISRLGNIHVIYPSFSKNSYEKIIKKRVAVIIDNIKKTTNINIEVTDAMYQTIYDNSVFPTQGVRPVFTTISSMFESKLSLFVLKAIESNQSKIIIDFDNGNIVSKIKNKIIKQKISCLLDKIKEDTSIEVKTLVSVHEAAHALVYAMKFKTAPLQIKANLVNRNGGFMSPHIILNSKQQILNDVQVLLAGYIAEALIFGIKNRTSGAVNDLETATRNIGSYIRSLGMNGNIGVINSDKNTFGYSNLIHNEQETDKEIENILKDCEKECHNLLEQNQNLLIKISDYLIKNNNLNAKEFCKLVKNELPHLIIKEAKEYITEDYKSLYEQHKKRMKYKV